MKVAFDNTFLTLLVNPGAQPRPDPATGKPVPHYRQRIEALIDRLSRKGGTEFIVPTPCLAEALVASADIQKVVTLLRGYAAVDIASFDARSAIELAMITKEARASGAKNSGVDLPYQQVKFDRQIVAIARAHGASVLFTDDDGQSKFAEMAGLTVKHSWDLELPPEYAQHRMFEEHDGKG